MEKMYQDYKDIAEFYIVYISEAHAADDRSPVGYAKELGINEHTNYGERCTVAARLQKDKKLTIPCLIDGMDNKVEESYKGWPDRVFVVRKDGKLAIAGRRGPWGFVPGMNMAKSWLASYKETGREPAIVVDDTPDIRGLMREFYAAMRSSDYDKAIDLGAKLHKASPDDVGTMYNLACVHNLNGDKKNAYKWLEKAIHGGYDNADHMLEDDDLASIREEDRFKNLVRRVREMASSEAAAAGDSASFEPILGSWEMSTQFGGQSIHATMVLSLKGGKLVGVWTSQGRDMPLTDLKFAGNTLSFARSVGQGAELKFKGTVDGTTIKGMYSGAFGELESSGTRK